MGRYIFFAFAALVLLLSCNARADLVWTRDQGWQVQGGVLANVLGDVQNVSNALEAMNEGKKAQDAGDYRVAIGYYKIVTTGYPDSIFAPEAYFQMAKAYVARGQHFDAYLALQEVVKRYSDYPRFNQIVGEEFNVASIIQGGATPYIWGWFPWFTNYQDAVKIYESVVSNAPYSDYAPIALMNIALIAEEDGKFDMAFDALDRLINTYPNSMFTPDAYLQMAKVYRNLVEGPEYDQTPTRNAVSFFRDYLILFPNEAQIAKAEDGLETMEDTYARSRLVMGDFYYYYRNNNVAASIFYNETITIAPNSPAAGEAKIQLEKIARGEPAPMTPYDWIWGRYTPPSVDEYENGGKAEDLNDRDFEVTSVGKFLESSGAADRSSQGGKPVSCGEFAPLYGSGLDKYLMNDGFYECSQDEIENAL